MNQQHTTQNIEYNSERQHYNLTSIMQPTLGKSYLGRLNLIINSVRAQWYGCVRQKRIMYSDVNSRLVKIFSFIQLSQKSLNIGVLRIRVAVAGELLFVVVLK